MKRRAFSLVEILIVLTIISILAAILYPVFQRVKDQAKVARSMSNLRQFSLAMTMYREDHAGPTSLCGLGTPPGLAVLAREHQIPRAMLRTGGSNFGRPNGDVYTYMLPRSPNDGLMPEWQSYYAEVGENAVCILDETQNPGVTSKFSPFRTLRVIGLRLNGSVQVRRIRGISGIYSSWK
jgi:prepilin-type N-terminal cleavage/methylation domain-containing protein